MEILKFKPGYEEQAGINITKIQKLCSGERNRGKNKAITKCKRRGLGMDMVMIEGESEDQNMWSVANEGEMTQVEGGGGDDKVKRVGMGLPQPCSLNIRM